MNDTPSNWDKLTLGDAINRGNGLLQTGPFGSQLHASDYLSVGVPFVMPVNIGDNRLLDKNLARIAEKDAARLSRHRLRTGDIIYSRRGDVEKRALIRPEQEGWICGSGCLLVRSGMGVIDPTYLAYYLGHPSVREWIVRHAVGATMPNLNTSIMGALPVLLPPLSEQRTIASILGTLDDKIELNRRMNVTLEAMARAVFESWFVNFDPVRAKADGRETGLPAEIAALFPDGFVESEFGEIPEGWEFLGLDDVARFLNGLALQKYPPTNNCTLPVVKIAQLRAGHTTGADTASADIPPEYIVGDGDVLFSWSGSLECVLWAGGTGALNQHLFKVTSASYPKWSYYFWIHEHLDDFRRIAAGKATTMGHIQRHHLTEAKVVVPPRPVILAANKSIEPLLEMQWRSKVQNRNLANLRDALLPKLVSGELRIPDAHKLINEVVA